MNALQPCLDPKPADPVRFPAGRPVTTATHRASQLGNGLPEACRAHFLWNTTGVGCDQGEHLVFDDFLGRAFRVATGEIPHWQPTDGQRREQTHHATQACHRWDVPFFDVAASCETGVIVFDAPPATLPFDMLSCLLDGRRRHTGHQEPLPWLFVGGRVFFPHPDGPKGERLGAAPRFPPRRHHADRAKGKPHIGLACGSPMGPRNRKGTAGLHPKGANGFHHGLVWLPIWLHAPMFTHPHQKRRVGGLACQKEGEQIGSSVSHVDDGRLPSKRTQPGDHAHPDIRLALRQADGADCGVPLLEWACAQRVPAERTPTPPSFGGPRPAPFAGTLRVPACCRVSPRPSMF